MFEVWDSLMDFSMMLIRRGDVVGMILGIMVFILDLVYGYYMVMLPCYVCRIYKILSEVEE